MRIAMLALIAVTTLNTYAADAPTAPPPTLWPIEAPLPGFQTRDGKPPIRIWLPSETKKIRAALVIVENSDSKFFGEYAPLREVARKHEMAVIHAFLRPHDKVNDPENIQSMDKVMNAVAEKTGIAEFKHAPWITFGKSSQGAFPFQVAWKYPKRTIATICYHAETPTWPVPDWVKLEGETVLHVNANGEAEWGGTWYTHVRPALMNYRANTGWLAHQIVARSVAHGDYPGSKNGWIVGAATPGRVCTTDTFDYLTVFVDKALTLRLPAGQYPTEAPFTLKQVDGSTGYYIEPFAIEDLWQLRRLPLFQTPQCYASATPTMGFTEIEPAASFSPPEGVPVVKPVSGQSPAQWLITEAVPFFLKTDPMSALNGLEALRPKPGDPVKIEQTDTTFAVMPPKYAGSAGGIVLNKGLQQSGSFTLLGYTVLDIAEPRNMKLIASFTPGGRLQVVINGQPVEHLQTVAFKKGLYPVLVVLSMKAYHGVSWASIEPRFEDVTDEQVSEAKTYETVKVKQRAEAATRQAEVAKNAAAVLHPASDVKPEDRKKMFWVADKEQADAWLKYHQIMPVDVK